MCDQRRGIDCNLMLRIHKDVRYLKPHVEDVVKEDLERQKWDNIEVKRTR